MGLRWCFGVSIFASFARGREPVGYVQIDGWVLYFMLGITISTVWNGARTAVGREISSTYDRAHLRHWMRAAVVLVGAFPESRSLGVSDAHASFEAQGTCT